MNQYYSIQGGRRLEGTVTISGAKNAAVAIIPASILAGECCILENLPSIQDVQTLKHILSRMGAQVDFTLDGAHYTYRSARTEEDISGLYVNYAEESTGIALCGEYWSLELDVKPIVEGGFAGFWSQDGVASTLYTPDDVDQTVFTSLCETLAGYDWLHRSEDNWYPAEVQDPDSGVWLPAIRLTVEECSPTGGAFTIHNDGASPLTYGDAYSLEKLVDGVWRTVPVNIMETQNFGWGFNDIAYEIPYGGEDSFRIDWTWLYGTLTDGQYRLVKSVTPAEGQSPVELRAEFTSLYVINGD